MSDKNNIIHLVSGGVAGTVGAIVTCPLEVVKTRLQSSASKEYRLVENQKGKSDAVNLFRRPFSAVIPLQQNALSVAGLEGENIRRANNGFKTTRTLYYGSSCELRKLQPVSITSSSGREVVRETGRRMGLISCIRYIVANEGPQAMFRGLGPTLLGVAPARSVYFWTYSRAKKFLNEILPPESHRVHILAAASGGFMSSTLTNPIWFIKTRLQLDKGKYKSVGDCIRQVYQDKGLLGFYRGITASYFGICETAIHFVIYESLKTKLDEYKKSQEFVVISHFEEDEWALSDRAEASKKTLTHFMEYMGAGATSKTIASCLAYPHEVARTRLREEGNKHRGFFHCLSRVYHEEGYRGLYRGLTTHLIRQIPNTAIVLATYEACVYLFSDYGETEVVVDDRDEVMPGRK